MKKITKASLVKILAANTIIWYLLASFAQWDYNAGNWEVSERVGLITLDAISIGVNLLYISDLWKS